MTTSLLDHEVDTLATLARARHASTTTLLADRAAQHRLEAAQLETLAPLLYQTLEALATLSEDPQLRVPVLSMTWVRRGDRWVLQDIWSHPSCTITATGQVFGPRHALLPHGLHAWWNPNGDPAERLTRYEVARRIRLSLEWALHEMDQRHEAAQVSLQAASADVTLRLLLRSQATLTRVAGGTATEPPRHDAIRS